MTFDRQLRRGGIQPADSSLAFIEGVDYTVEDRGYETPCHIWHGWIDSQGYGRTLTKHPERRAHREAYRQANGDIPAGQDIHHRCEVEACINADHLEVTVHAIHLAYHKQEASSLTWEIVRAIREEAKQGVGHVELRERYGIAQPTLSDIVTGKTWKDAAYVPGFIVHCALPECGQPFAGRGAHKKFCCPAHRTRHNQRLATRYYERRAA